MALNRTEWHERYLKLRMQIQAQEIAIASALFSPSRSAHGLSSAKKVMALAGDLVELESKIVQLTENAK